MELSKHLSLSYYKTIATISEEHKIYVVQHQSTKRLYIKKILDIYNAEIYQYLLTHSVQGIPRLIELFEENSQLIIIEEYISGTPLNELIKQKNLTYTDALIYVKDICRILDKLHTLNPPIIHRDIKPSNITITNYNRAILLDFNAAKLFSKSSTEDTILLGTQGYAAPEQYGFGSSSPQTDIYALGIVLREILNTCSYFPNDLNTIIKKCTEINPNERYTSVLELEADLDLLLKPEHHQLKSKKIYRFLPPGFRSQTPWKMLFSSIFYVFIIWLSLTLESTNVIGLALWIERIFCLLIFISIIFGTFNYMNIQRLIPLCKSSNKILKYIGVFILDISLVFLLFLVLFILESIFF